MTLPTDRKLYLGPRLRILRRELGLNQTRMAEELGVSPSYLNHLERNQRPLTAQILLRLAHTYDIDVRDFVAGANEAAASDLHEIFADALVRDIGIPRHEVIEVAENYPSVAEAVARLYRALVDLRAMPDRIEHLGSGSTAASPLEWLRQYLEHKHNYFGELDMAAETLATELGGGPEALFANLSTGLHGAFGISVQIVPHSVLLGVLRHFDIHRRRLPLSERLTAPSRLFAVAYQFVLQQLGKEIDEQVARAGPPDRESATLARIALANYAAAALLMPYARFHAAADENRWDVDLLCARFGTSYEQVAHRLTTLGRPSARGIPFFLLKLDVAGNVAKRFAGESLPLARFGGGCPRWGIQRAFRLPGETIAAHVEAPDGARYFTMARAFARPAGTGLVAVVLGCEASYASRIAAATPLGEAPIPIGPACHLCERPECPERALPPVTRALDLREYQRPVAPYPFRAT